MEERQDCGTALVVDDDPGSRALVAGLLGDAGYAIEEAADGDAALASAQRVRPSLVILDVNLPGLSGYEVCRRLRERYDGVPIIFISGDRVESHDRVAGLLVGGDDYLVKPYAPDELLARIRTVRRRLNRSRRDFRNLTPRELDVLRLLADGLTQRAIAELLTISPKTVRTHIDHVLGKLNARNRAQAIAIAYRERIVEPRQGGGAPH